MHSEFYCSSVEDSGILPQLPALVDTELLSDSADTVTGGVITGLPAMTLNSCISSNRNVLAEMSGYES